MSFSSFSNFSSLGGSYAGFFDLDAPDAVVDGRDTFGSSTRDLATGSHLHEQIFALQVVQQRVDVFTGTGQLDLERGRQLVGQFVG